MSAINPVQYVAMRARGVTPAAPDTTDRDDWRERALCRDAADPDLWYPAEGGTAPTDAAKAVCSRCPVRSECLAWALDRGEAWGVFGGMTAEERRQLRKGGAA